jgi:hypothetical protein
MKEQWELLTPKEEHKGSSEQGKLGGSYMDASQAQGSHSVIPPSAIMEQHMLCPLISDQARLRSIVSPFMSASKIFIS